MSKEMDGFCSSFKMRIEMRIEDRNKRCNNETGFSPFDLYVGVLPQGTSEII